MALPAAFVSETKYFEEAMLFLKENQKYFNYPNTDVLVEGVIEKINLPDPETLDVFEKDFDIARVPEIKILLQRIERLNSFHMRQQFEDLELENFENVPLGRKKKHEISFLAQEIRRVSLENGCDTIIDFGCGLGYLDQLLSKKFNYHVLGLESNDNILRGARKRQKVYHKESIDNVKYAKHYIDGASAPAVESLLEKIFPSSRNVCIVGLHACADLTVNAINIFMAVKKAKCLVLMPCCYHKMSLRESEGSRINKAQNTEIADSREIKDVEETKTVLEERKEFSGEPNVETESNCESFCNCIQEQNIIKSANQATEASNPSNVLKCQRFCNFPLSEKFKLIYTACGGCSFLRIPFLRLAAQPPSIDEDLRLLVFRMMSRAVLQLYCYKHDLLLVKKKRRAVKIKDQTTDIRLYLEDATVNGYAIKCKDSSCTANKQYSAEDTFQGYGKACKCEVGFDVDIMIEMWQHNCNDIAAKKAAILILIQRYLQPMFENLVLFDRIVYLKEQGVQRCEFLKVVDETISPRCLALVAAK